MIRRGRHFRPLVTGSPRPLPRPSPAASAVVTRDHRWLRSSHLPLSGTGAGLSANRGREATHTSGKPAGSLRFSRRASRRGRGEAAWRRIPVRLRAEGCAVEVGFRKRQRTVFPLSSASSVPDTRVSQEGPSVPAAGAWPRTSGPPFADWWSAAVTPPAGHAPGAGPRSRETPGDLALPRGLLGAPQARSRKWLPAPARAGRPRSQPTRTCALAVVQ